MLAASTSEAAGESDFTPIPDLSPRTLGSWLAASVQAAVPQVAREMDFCRRFEEAERAAREVSRRELPVDIDPHELQEAGWGVIFPPAARRSLSQRLKTLLDLRESQAGKKRFKRFTYQPGEPAAVFLARNGETLGTIKPEKVPYYLLIAGGPEEIPFEFQYHLGLNHAVGRLHFTEAVDYRRYAQHVYSAETEEVERPRRTAIFSVENDRVTSLLAKYLVKPLERNLKGYLPDWDLEVWRKSRASKTTMGRLLGERAPGLLLASCHGSYITPGHSTQEARQGALVCHSPSEEKILFSAADVPVDAELRGQIAFLFSCYGTGTPVIDNFPYGIAKSDSVIQGRLRWMALRPFIARLPQALLARGTLAVLGHVDRGWTLSCAWQEKKSGKGNIDATASLQDALKRLLKGERLGHSLRPLARRYAFLAARLAITLHQVELGIKPDPEQLGMLWTAVNDARNLIVLGDPAVYLLGQRCFSGDTVELDGDLVRYAREKAESRGEPVERWIGRLIEARALEDGIQLGKPH